MGVKSRQTKSEGKNVVKINQVEKNPTKTKLTTTKQQLEEKPKNDLDNDNLLDEKTFVCGEKITESLQVLNSVTKHYEEHGGGEAEKKKPLFEQDEKMVLLEVVMKKIPQNSSTYIHSFELPYHWRHQQADFSTCLIVSDVNRQPLTDRDLDLEQTKGRYFDILESSNATELIKEILPLRQLRNEFRAPALRKKLANQYSAFLCDRKLLQNKYTFLNRFLGKQFWIDTKKVPLLIDLKDVKTLREQIQTKLNQTTLYLSGKGSTYSICVGSLEQPVSHLAANTTVVLTKLKQLFADNIRSLSVKTEKSMAITFYLDLASSNEVQLPVLAKSGKNRIDSDYVEDEFDFLVNSSVRVYRDGNIMITKRDAAAGTAANNDDDTQNEEKAEEEEEEKPDEEEEKLIAAINRSAFSDDHDWIRRKVDSFERSNGAGKRSFGVKRRVEVQGGGEDEEEKSVSASSQRELLTKRHRH